MKDIILKGEEAIERYNQIKEQGLLLFECVVGSTAYGTNTPTSDIDKKFIYIDPFENVLNGTVSSQISITDDYVGYEIGRYLSLLITQNPNIIELINSDPQHIEYCHPLFRKLVIDRKDEFLSNKVAFSFGQYAKTQIKKAQGTNKKFMNPMPKERKTLLDFCWVHDKGQSRSLKEWLERYISVYVQPYSKVLYGKEIYVPDWMYGCVSIEHMKNCFALYLDKDGLDKFWSTDDEVVRDSLFAGRKYNGIKDRDGVQIKLSSVAKGELPICMFYCNIEGFSFYCKEYKEYWEWDEKKNPQRFVENSESEHNYDRKNMMHCHRLLDMCIEILETGNVYVYRPNREELLGIRNGQRKYQELIDWANEKYDRIEKLYETTSLPESIDPKIVEDIVVNLRKEFYSI